MYWPGLKLKASKAQDPSPRGRDKLWAHVLNIRIRTISGYLCRDREKGGHEVTKGDRKLVVERGRTFQGTQLSFLILNRHVTTLRVRDIPEVAGNSKQAKFSLGGVPMCG